jgi:hypothetical protein
MSGSTSYELQGVSTTPLILKEIKQWPGLNLKSETHSSPRSVSLGSSDNLGATFPGLLI